MEDNNSTAVEPQTAGSTIDSSSEAVKMIQNAMNSIGSEAEVEPTEQKEEVKI